MKKYAYKIYVHFKNSEYDYTFITTRYTKKTAIAKLEKMLKSENIIRGKIIKTERGLISEDAKKECIYYTL